MRGSRPKATAAAAATTTTAAATTSAAASATAAEAVQHRGVPGEAEGPRPRQRGRHQNLLRVSILLSLGWISRKRDWKLTF